MIYYDGTEPQKIKDYKEKLGIEGDVYIYNDIFIENLAGHKKLIPSSTANTIEEAYEERVAYEEELEEQRRKAIEEAVDNSFDNRESFDESEIDVEYENTLYESEDE